MSTRLIVPRPRLQRPERGPAPFHPREVFARKHPRVVMAPAEGGPPSNPHQRARRQILVVYGLFAVMLIAGRLAQSPARAEQLNPGSVGASSTEQSSVDQLTARSVVVGEHTFTEVAPEQSALLTAPGEQRTALISHYWPPLGGVNCATFRDGQCVSNMASGLPWWAWVGRAAACPGELPFWTTVTLPGGETFVCLDRGGKIVTTAAGELWIDLLVESAPVPYGTAMDVTVRLPWGEGQ